MNRALKRQRAILPAHLERKSVAQSVFALHGLDLLAGDPGDVSPTSFERNSVVYRCVRMIAENSASLPLVAYEGELEMDEHPAIALMRRPSALQTGRGLVEQLIGHLLLWGEAYCLLTGEGEMRELHPLPPDCMHIETGDDGWPRAYVYTTGNQKTRYHVQEDHTPILAMRLFNPNGQTQGLAPLEAAKKAIAVHDRAAEWNEALLRNSARPSGALVYSNEETGNLTPEQFSRLKQELEEGYTGATTAGRPMVLEGGLDWKAMGYSPRDMDFIEAKNSAAREIALAFGVPPMLLGIPGDNTYANYKEANRAFWTQTVLPMADHVAERFASWLGPVFASELRFSPNRDGLEALSSDLEAQWKRVGDADFLTVNEKRLALGYSPLEGGDGLSINPKAKPAKPEVQT